MSNNNLTINEVTVKYRKKLIMVCLAFTYCVFVMGIFFNGFTITHKFDENNKAAKLQLAIPDFSVKHSLGYDNKLKLSIENDGAYSLPFKIELKDGRH